MQQHCLSKNTSCQLFSISADLIKTKALLHSWRKYNNISALFRFQYNGNSTAISLIVRGAVSLKQCVQYNNKGAFRQPSNISKWLWAFGSFKVFYDKCNDFFFIIWSERYASSCYRKKILCCYDVLSNTVKPQLVSQLNQGLKGKLNKITIDYWQVENANSAASVVFPIKTERILGILTWWNDHKMITPFQ